MLQFQNAFGVPMTASHAASAGPVRQVVPLLSPEEQRGGIHLACCRDDSVVIQYFPDNVVRHEEHEEKEVVGPVCYSLPPKAEAYTVWSTAVRDDQVGATTALRSAIIYALPVTEVANIDGEKENDDDEEEKTDATNASLLLGSSASSPQLFQAVRFHQLRLQTPDRRSFPLLDAKQKPIVMEDVQAVRVLYVHRTCTILAVQGGTAIQLYQLPTAMEQHQMIHDEASTSSSDSLLLSWIFANGKKPPAGATRGLALKRLGESIEIPGGRRSLVLLEAFSSLCLGKKSSTDEAAVAHLVFAALEGKRLHAQVFSVTLGSPSSAYALQLMAQSADGSGVALPAGMRMEGWAMDWAREELVLQLQMDSTAGDKHHRNSSGSSSLSASQQEQQQLARLPLFLSSDSSNSVGAQNKPPQGHNAPLNRSVSNARLLPSTFLLSSSAPPPYVNAATRLAVEAADELLFSCTSSGATNNNHTEAGDSSKSTSAPQGLRSVWTVRRHWAATNATSRGLASTSSAALLLLVKDIGSPRQSEYQLISPQTPPPLSSSSASSQKALFTPEAETVIATTVMHTRSDPDDLVGEYVHEELVVLLGATLFRIPAYQVKPAAPLVSASARAAHSTVTTGAGADHSLCGWLLQARAKQGSTTVEGRKTAAKKTAMAATSAVLAGEDVALKVVQYLQGLHTSSSSPSSKSKTSPLGRQDPSAASLLPRVLRDTDFVTQCPPLADGTVVYRHAVLDRLLVQPATGSAASSSSAVVRRQLLHYLGRCETLHPLTICRAMLWAGAEKGLLLALASVLSSKRELQGGAGGEGGGPSRLPGWQKVSLWAYRESRETQGDSTSAAASGVAYFDAVEQSEGRQCERLLWRHTAALADACVTAVGLGSHSALLLLLQVLSTAITTLYASPSTSSARTSDSGLQLAEVHAAEACVMEALHVLSLYTEWTSQAGSAWGNLTAHLPAVVPLDSIPSNSTSSASASKRRMLRPHQRSDFIVATERKKEAGLRPGWARPIQTSRDVDITPLTL